MRRSVVLVALIFLLAVVGLFIGFRDLQDLSDGRRAQVTSRKTAATAPDVATPSASASATATSDTSVGEPSISVPADDQTASNSVPAPSSGGGSGGESRERAADRTVAEDDIPAAADGASAANGEGAPTRVDAEPVLEPEVPIKTGREQAGSDAATTPSEVQQATRQPAAETPALAAPLPRDVAPDLARPEAVGPSFDIVRVEPSGEAVVAGRAQPGSRVSLFDSGERLGGAIADSQGQWVIVLDRALAPGGHELSIEARGDDDSLFVSPNVVIVSVPEPAPVQTASAPAAGASGGSGDAGRASDGDVAAAGATETAARAAGGSEAEEAASPQTSVPVAAVSARSEAAPTPMPSTSELAARGDAPLPLAVLVPRTGSGAAEILQHPEPPRGGAGADALRLATVNYDEAGVAVIGGRAPAGASVLLYLNDEELARATADREGRWSARLDRPIGRGVHELRVDQVDETGRVVAQVRSPFARAEIVAGLPDETAVVVQPGNSLWRIARRIYGEGVRYTVIYDANKGAILDPDLIYPGQIFTVPTAD